MQVAGAGGVRALLAPETCAMTSKRKPRSHYNFSVPVGLLRSIDTSKPPGVAVEPFAWSFHEDRAEARKRKRLRLDPGPLYSVDDF